MLCSCLMALNLATGIKGAPTGNTHLAAIAEHLAFVVNENRIKIFTASSHPRLLGHRSYPRPIANIRLLQDTPVACELGIELVDGQLIRDWFRRPHLNIAAF